MADWFYTADKQQLGPVALEELRQRANQGLLKPTDLVWREGMSAWKRASTLDLFTEDAPLAAADDAISPRHRSASEAQDRQRHADTGLAVGIKIGLIVGVGVVLLLITSAVLYFLLRPSRTAAQVAVGMGNFPDTLRRGDPRDVRKGGPCRVYTVHMTANRTYTIDLRSGQFDAYLRLEDSGRRHLTEDDDTGGGVNGLDAHIAFRCPRTDTYRVIATSLDHGFGFYSLSMREN